MFDECLIKSSEGNVFVQHSSYMDANQSALQSEKKQKLIRGCGFTIINTSKNSGNTLKVRRLKVTV